MYNYPFTMPEVPNVAETPRVFERVFDSQIVRVVVSVGAFLTAAVLLGFKDDITKSWPLSAWPGFGGHVVLAAAIYWSASSLLLGVGICQYFAADQKTARIDRVRTAEKATLNSALSDLKGHLERVKRDLETLPGGSAFREQFALRADDLQLLLTTALSGSLDASDLESGVRSQVASIAHLASLYGPTGANTCHAYVMRFVAQPTDKECELVHMVPGDGRFDAKNGLLLAELGLAADMDGSRDSRVQPFALAAVHPGTANSLPNCFAAQAAFAGKDVAGIAEVERYIKPAAEMDNPGDVAFAKAYGSHSWAFGKSLISSPLCVPLGKARREKIGVVTITSDGSNIMGGVEERWEIFWMIMRPYTDGIAVLLKLLLKLKKIT